jgi:hypothetical protein
MIPNYPAEQETRLDNPIAARLIELSQAKQVIDELKFETTSTNVQQLSAEINSASLKSITTSQEPQSSKQQIKPATSKSDDRRLIKNQIEDIRQKLKDVYDQAA